MYSALLVYIDSKTFVNVLLLIVEMYLSTKLIEIISALHNIILSTFKQWQLNPEMLLDRKLLSLLSACMQLTLEVFL